MYLVSDPTCPRQPSNQGRAAFVTDRETPAGERLTIEDPCDVEEPCGSDFDATVVAARNGDELAFNQLFRAAHPGLLRYLRVLVSVDAEDVASETWLQIARDFHTFSGDWDGFRGWAATIARHRAIDHVRRQKRRTEVAVPMEQFSDVPSSVDTADEAVGSVSTDLAIALIARLPQEQAEAVMLRVVIGLDSKMSGQILGRRAGAVRTAAHRGLRQLDQFFGRDLDRMFGRLRPNGKSDGCSGETDIQ